MRMDDFLKCDLSIILICSTHSTILGFLFLGFFGFFFFFQDGVGRRMIEEE